MNLVEYELDHICEMLAPICSGGVAEQFIRRWTCNSEALSSSPPPDRQLDLFSVVPSSTP